MTSLEEMKIYQALVDLLYYTYNITLKYPKIEKDGIVMDIKFNSIKALEELIIAQKMYEVKQRLYHLDIVDSELKVIKVLIRISYKMKYITSKNYSAWSKKITSVNNLLNGWIKKCVKQ